MSQQIIWKKIKRKNKEYGPYAYLYESYRDQATGQPKKKYIRYLGKLPSTVIPSTATSGKHRSATTGEVELLPLADYEKIMLFSILFTARKEKTLYTEDMVNIAKQICRKIDKKPLENWQHTFLPLMHNDWITIRRNIVKIKLRGKKLKETWAKLAYDPVFETISY